MYVKDVIWDENNTEHIAYHNVAFWEVEEVLWDDRPWFEKRRGQQRYQVFGQTVGGRYLLIILDREYDDVFYVVTARDLTGTEKRHYQQRRK